MLIVAALLSAGLGDVADTVIILIIVLISSLLGFWQEKGAANAVSELLKMVALHCAVLRDGKSQEILMAGVVPGDIVLLSAGDVIPADSLILQIPQELFVDEAAFTGETYPVIKDGGVLPVDTPLAKRTNALFMGSHVISGKASVLVVKTGLKTEFRQIRKVAVVPKRRKLILKKGSAEFGYMLMEYHAGAGGILDI